MYCIIKCTVQGKQARVKKRRFASSVLHSCNVNTQICVTRPQCVKSAKFPAYQHKFRIAYSLHSSPSKLYVETMRCHLATTRCTVILHVPYHFQGHFCVCDTSNTVTLCHFPIKFISFFIHAYLS